jgi:orotate phosphoribosyltransferase
MLKSKDYLTWLRELGGYYECRVVDGHHFDPLVGYAGRYEGLHRAMQYVGRIYANFAVVEKRPVLLSEVADDILALDFPLEGVCGFCGAPEGGKALAVMLGHHSGLEYIFPEEKVTQVATATSRKISEFFFGRHQPKEGEVWWIVEDVCNNFSTTAKLIALIESYGAKVGGIICFLNRSLEVDETFVSGSGDSFPVVALVRKPFGQFRQDDPAVQGDISSGNIVWKPKDEWQRLEESQRREITILVPKDD